MTDATVRRAPGEAPHLLAEHHAALGRRRRADDGRRPLGEPRRAGAAHPGVPGLRGALPVPRAEPAARTEVARRSTSRRSRSTRASSTTSSASSRSWTRRRRAAASTRSRSWTGATSRSPRKLLQRPGAIRRIRDLVGDPEMAIILPFCITEDEVELAVRLGLPIYGSDPALGWLGTKTGSRRVFEEEGVPHPVGLEIGGEDDVLPALHELRGRSLRARRAILKLDDGVSGLGNAIVDLHAAERDLRGALRARGRRDRPGRVPRGARPRRRHRRGADRGRGVPQPERAAPHQPGRPGGRHVDARPGARRHATG